MLVMHHPLPMIYIHCRKRRLGGPVVTFFGPVSKGRGKGKGRGKREKEKEFLRLTIQVE